MRTASLSSDLPLSPAGKDEAESVRSLLFPTPSSRPTTTQTTHTCQMTISLTNVKTSTSGCRTQETERLRELTQTLCSAFASSANTALTFRMSPLRASGGAHVPMVLVSLRKGRRSPRNTRVNVWILPPMEHSQLVLSYVDGDEVESPRIAPSWLLAKARVSEELLARLSFFTAEGGGEYVLQASTTHQSTIRPLVFNKGSRFEFTLRSPRSRDSTSRCAFAVSYVCLSCHT